MSKILLASQSPRRKELLGKILTDFEVESYDADENFLGATPEETVLEISRRKFLAVPKRERFEVIITCDTLVYMDGKYYGKPSSYADGAKMLAELQGRTHRVVSGLTVAVNGKVFAEAVTSFVTFRALDDRAIKAYLDSHHCLDKAGAYAIQDGVVVERYEGSYTNIVGMPMETLEKILGACGII